MSATEADAGDGSEASDESKTPEELTTVIRAEVLQQVVDQMLSVVNEAILHIGREGIEVAAVDPGNVAMVDISVDPGAFEKVGDGMFPIGLNIQRLDDYLDGATGDDPVTLAYIPEKRMLNIQHTNVDIDMAAIDPAAIREEPDIPDLDPSAEFTVSASDFTNSLEKAELASDHVEFDVDVSEREMVVLGQGDTDDVRSKFDDERLIEYDFGESISTLYSLAYFIGGSKSRSSDRLKGLMTPIPGSTEITCRFGDESPMKIGYEFADGYGEVMTMIAPRIESR